MYKYEMHLHSIRCSACAVSTAEEQVRALYEKGYAGAVFTNHFYYGNTAVSRSLDWADFVAEYAEDYMEAKKLGDELGLDIFFGVEEGYGRGKEVLIYGIEPETFIACPEFVQMSLDEMSGFVRENGGFIACAHPFREAFYIPDPDIAPDPELLDGVEVFNRGNEGIWNDKAVEYCSKNGLVPISGGDVHECSKIGFAGIATERRITSSAELVRVLKNREHKLIIDGEIV